MKRTALETWTADDQRRSRRLLMRSGAVATVVAFFVWLVLDAFTRLPAAIKLSSELAVMMLCLYPHRRFLADRSGAASLKLTIYLAQTLMFSLTLLGLYSLIQYFFHPALLSR